MAEQIIHIPCIDSGSGNYLTNGSYNDYYGNTIFPDNIIRPDFVSDKQYPFDVPTQFYFFSPVRPIFLFENIDISFLEHRKLISCNIVLTVKNSGGWQKLVSTWEFVEKSVGINFITANSPIDPLVIGKTSGMSLVIQNSVSVGGITTPTIYSAESKMRIPVTSIASIELLLKNGLTINLNTSQTDSSTRGGESASFYRQTDDLNTPYIEIIYDDAPVYPTVYTAQPKNVIVDATQKLTFEWTYHQSFNQPQSHFDLQYYGASDWVSLADMVISSEHSLTIPANTLPNDLPSGETRWRVRAYVEDGLAVSEWSDEAPFIVRSSPPKPNIAMATNTPRPEFIWQSYVQDGYQIRLTQVTYAETGELLTEESVYESPEIYGVETRWKYFSYLPNGKYRFYVRVINEFSLWSEWAVVEVYSENQPVGSIQLSAQASCNGTMRLHWTTSNIDGPYYVLRNGTVIAHTEALEYEDFTSLGITSYTVRATHGDFYTDSNTVTDTVRVKNAVISTLPASCWLNLKIRRGGVPEHSESNGPVLVFVQYEDVDTEIGYSSDYTSEEHRLSFSFKNREEYERIKAMCGKQVVYKDCWGTLLIGHLSGPNASLVRVIDFDFNIHKTQYIEEVPYD